MLETNVKQTNRQADLAIHRRRDSAYAEHLLPSDVIASDESSDKLHRGGTSPPDDYIGSLD